MNRRAHPLLLGERSVDVQHEGVRVGAQLGDDERHTLRHQPRDERHIAREAIELRRHHGGLRPLRLRQRIAQHRSAIERIGPLAGFDLGQLADQFQGLGGHEAVHGFTLRLEAQAALALRRDVIMREMAEGAGRGVELP